jgi:SAM-dependent methyltransferase
VNRFGFPAPELLPSRQVEDALIAQAIRHEAKQGRPLKILEAGCGQKWGLDLTGIDYTLTGVDLDPAALRIRRDVTRDLDIAVEGDLRTVSLGGERYDVIYSSFVLEHVPEVERVLARFGDWIEPGGLLVIRVPDPKSVHGFITSATPHAFHVWYYRTIKKHPNAGKPGFVPYPVHYSAWISRSGIRQFARAYGFSLVGEYGDGYVRPGYGFARAAIHVAKGLLSALSLGRLTARHTNVLYFLRSSDAGSPGGSG